MKGETAGTAEVIAVAIAAEVSEPELAVAGDESQGEVVDDTIRYRVAGDGLGQLRKGEQYAKPAADESPAAEEF